LKQEVQKARSLVEVDRGNVVARGGVVVLVQTDKPIAEWEQLASRELTNVEWVWKEDLFSASKA